ncbi:MAG: S26 family signal peptidase [Euryarchaeota archaeon]|nr:S26 family signal peptidase [Euryarchaeota archaeon]
MPDRASQSGPSRRPEVRPEDETPAREIVRKVKELWRTDQPSVAVPRDILLALVVIAVLLGGLWGYTGQPFPEESPLVVVESGSMMHPAQANYGHVGTIDPGDLIFVKRVDSAEDVVSAHGALATGSAADQLGGGGRDGYGGHGDVVIYHKYGRGQEVPIIHRAITWVEVHDQGIDQNGSRILSFDYHDELGRWLTDQPSVTLWNMGIIDMKFPTSGFVTKGDNPQSNQRADQLDHMPGQLVQADWIVGKARGEIPWLGLVKLAFTGNQHPSDTTGFCRFASAWGLCDTWVMLGLSIVTVIGVPLALDALVKKRGGRWTGY